MKKLRLGFDKKSWRELKELVEFYQTITMAQALRNAISFATFLNQYLKQGWEITLTKGNETIRVTSPCFPKETTLPKKLG
ncbi:MAG: hypothetical protein A2469_03220 [Candidatus Magasanikbacteria bacterium RIFOXYC2_FULL_40_16]|uniref:Uncharacterized protein n=1 Tax=Candidatus Magasanikbacteria bacterium RIFOXYC2_FULL_40_16 TaxID=1798703 RepID=A0A1F6P1M3_9BACT|nr:MAG: hypothetical protein A2469_03220 [Candidatus Magasanikbacteria bacterium RIFOXYC2_FULL_40_16]